MRTRKGSVWLVHAEKIAEDAAEEICSRLRIVPKEQLSPGLTLRQYLTELVFNEISKTLELKE